VAPRLTPLVASVAPRLASLVATSAPRLTPVHTERRSGRCWSRWRWSGGCWSGRCWSSRLCLRFSV